MAKVGWIFHCKPNQLNKIESSQEISYSISETIPSVFLSESCEQCELEMIISCTNVVHQICRVLFICAILAYADSKHEYMQESLYDFEIG